MKKGLIWKILLGIGLCPFAAPFLFAHTRMARWTLADWLVLWSFVYWPTYLIGFVFLVVAIWKIRKK